MKKHSTLAILLYLSALCFAQPPVLVKDINPGPLNGLVFNDNQGIFVINNILYFMATDGVHGEELWRSDGTESGTWMVKDIQPGTQGSRPTQMAKLGNQLIFIADDGVNGDELWISDGTEAGTVLVKDINPGSASCIRRFLTIQERSYLVVDGVYYFAADDDFGISMLWRSDGTAVGTYFLGDVCWSCLFSNNFHTSWFTEMNGKLYFFADEDFWESDGTVPGTKKIMDINTIIGPTIPEHMVAHNGKLYFSASNNITFNHELWVSEGTAASTKMLKEITPGVFGSSFPRHFTAFGNHVYFVADDKLYRTNGTEAGTVQFGTLQAGNYFVYDHPNMAVANGKLFVVLKEDAPSDKIFMYATDGTLPATFEQLHQTSYVNFDPTYLITHNERVHFIAQGPGSSEFGICTSDGTSSGTTFTNFGQTFVSQFKHLTLVGNTLYFHYQTSTNGIELMKFDLPAVPLSATISPDTSVPCASDSTATITVEAEGGTEPYTYTWNVPGIDGPMANNLGAGQYSVTVSDAQGNSQVLTATVTEPTALSGTATSLPEMNGNDGSAAIAVQGGTPPYTYLWNTAPPASTPTVQGLTTGQYEVVVTDANGCTLNAGVFVDMVENTSERHGPSLSLAPSLATDRFSILSQQPVYNMSVSLFDPSGKGIKQWNNVATGQSLELSGLPNGVYFVAVKSDGTVLAMLELVVNNR